MRKKPRGGFLRSDENPHMYNRQFLHFLSETGSHWVSAALKLCVCVFLFCIFIIGLNLRQFISSCLLLNISP